MTLKLLAQIIVGSDLSFFAAESSASDDYAECLGAIIEDWREVVECRIGEAFGELT